MKPTDPCRTSRHGLPGLSCPACHRAGPGTRACHARRARGACVTAIATGARQGQALIELTVAMLVVVILVAGVVQFAELAGRKGETMAKVRVQAGTRALAAVDTPVRTPDYFHTWTEGDDETRHTADDEQVADYPLTLQRGITDQSVAQPGQWAYLAETRNDSHYTLAQATLPMAAMNFVYAEETRTVELMPAIRDWIYHRDSITVATDIWLPRLHLDGFGPAEGEGAE